MLINYYLVFLKFCCQYDTNALPVASNAVYYDMVKKAYLYLENHKFVLNDSSKAKVKKLADNIE